VSNPWRSRRIVAFAHQGGSFEGPSSTLFAIGQAIDNGASAIELDVHATRDRQIVVCHDETVDRTTNNHGAIADFTLAELRDMDNSYWWIFGETVTYARSPAEYVHRAKAPDDRRFAIATLEEVSTEFPGVLLNLDIKQSGPQVEPYEELLAKELDRLERGSSVIVASFHDAAIQSFRSFAPGVATSAATNEMAAFYFSLMEGSAPIVPPVVAFQVPMSFGGVDVVTPQFVEASHAADVAVHVWTVNDYDDMIRMVELEVDGIVSDRPTPLAALLKTRRCAWNGAM
jgi:glycerophosphoryl diester phosphodiesterase